VFDRVWSCLIKFEGHQTFKQQLKTFPLYSCLMGDLLFVWTAAYQTCLIQACVPRLLSGLYQLFDLCLIKHVSTVWPLTSTSACFVTKQCLLVFGRQTFIVCPGPQTFGHALQHFIACLVTKQCLMVFGRQTFLVCPGPKLLVARIFNNYSPKWRWLVVDIYRAAKRRGK